MPDGAWTRSTPTSLGYEIDFAAADPYSLPDVFAFAIEGRLDLPARGRMLRFVPLVLPEDTLA